MPKGAKKRAKLKKKQQGGHPAGSDGGAHANNNKEGSNNSSHGDAASDGNHLPIPLNIPHGTYGIYPSSPFFKPGQICAKPLSWGGKNPLLRLRRGWHSHAVRWRRPPLLPHLPTGRFMSWSPFSCPII
jgi:hypothetical protein